MHKICHYVIVAAAAVLCYHNNLQGDLVHDDIFAITTNPDVQGATHVASVFVHDFWGREMWDNKSHKSYRPLCTLTFRLNYFLHELRPEGYHLVNNFLHVISSCFFLYICDVIIFRRRSLATLSALTFAVHPIHVEAVSGIVGRADILACIFFQISFISYCRSAKADQLPRWQKHRWKFLTLSLASALLGTLCKEHAVSVLGVCVIYECLVINRRAFFGFVGGKNVRQQGAVLYRLIFTIASACIILFTRLSMNFGQQPFINKSDNPASFSSSLLTRVLTYLHVYSLNCWLLLCPVYLSYDWQMGSVALVESLADLRNVASVIFMIALLLLATTTVRQFNSEQQCSVLVGLLFLVIPFLPASNIFLRVGFVLAERILYIPSMGYAILVTSGFGQIQKLVSRRRRSQLMTVMSILLFLMSLRTAARNNVWLNRSALFTSGIQSTPDNAKMHYNYGNLMKDTGNNQAAIRHYKVALKLWSEHASSYNNLATLVENPKDAEYLYQLALHYNPSHAGAHFNLGILKLNQNQTQEALIYLRKAVHLEPNQAEYWTYLAKASQQTGDFRGAENALKTVIRLTPDDANALNNMAVFLNNINRTREAKIFYTKALDFQPGNHVAMVNLARLLRDHGQSTDAGQLLQRALSLSRDVFTLDAAAIHFYNEGKVQDALLMFKEAAGLGGPDAQVTLHYAQVLAAAGKLRESTDILKNAVKAQPNNADALLHLGSVLGLQGLNSEALENFKKAINITSNPGQLGMLYERIGNIHKDAGKYMEAKEAYKKAVQFDPHLGETHMNLGVLHHIQGDYKKARICYMKANELLNGHHTIKENLRKLSLAERTPGKS